MDSLFEHIPFILEWINDEPFRLFAVLSLGVSIVVFLFFRKEHPLYRVFATIMLFLGVFGIGYGLVSGPDPEPPTGKQETATPSTKASDHILVKALDSLNRSCEVSDELVQAHSNTFRLRETKNNLGHTVIGGSFIGSNFKDGNLQVELYNFDTAKLIAQVSMEDISYPLFEGSVPSVYVFCKLGKCVVDTHSRRKVSVLRVGFESEACARQLISTIETGSK